MLRWLALLLLFAAPVAAGPVEDAVVKDGAARLETHWAQANYATTGKDRQAAAFDALIAEADALVKRFPSRAEPLVWRGVAQTYKAGVVGGMQGFGLVKAARRDLEAAEKLDPAAASGLGLSQLGTLYYQVPGFPIAFGDRGKAARYLARALAVAPDSLAANLAYGDFLVEGGRFSKAEPVLLTALKAPPRRDQPLADKGRRAEAEALLVQVRAKLTK